VTGIDAAASAVGALAGSVLLNEVVAFTKARL
jgi:hypothetical protein